MRSPGLVQLLAPRHPPPQPAEDDPPGAAGAPLQENGAADWTEGPPAPDACAHLERSTSWQVAALQSWDSAQQSCDHAVRVCP